MNSSMNCTIKVYRTFKRPFKRLLKRYHSLGDDLKKLELELMTNPRLGVDLGGGFRKVRMAITDKGKGKSGGARIITMNLLISKDETEIGLFYIYDKSERESISDQELLQLKQANGL